MKPLVTIIAGALFLLPSPAISDATTASPKIGERIKNPTLSTVTGDKQPVIGKADVNVLVFFRPNHEYSRLGLEQIAKCERELEGKSVHWVAIVSSRYSADEAKATAKAAGIEMPVLIDKDDRVYASLALALHPMVVLTDKTRAITAYQPFRKVNFYDLVKAQVQHKLGELTDEQLAAVTKPAAASHSGAHKEAMRRVKLGRMMLKSGKFTKALDAADVAIEKAPDLAAAYTLKGLVFAAQKNCKKALGCFAKALELDPDDSDAADGKTACEEAATN